MSAFTTTQLPGIEHVVFYTNGSHSPLTPDDEVNKGHWLRFKAAHDATGWRVLVFSDDVPDDVRESILRVTGLTEGRATSMESPGNCLKGPLRIEPLTEDYVAREERWAKESKPTPVVSDASKTKPSILQRAHDVIYGDRAKSYGKASENHANTAAFMGAWFGARYPGLKIEDVLFDAYDTCAVNIGQKLARLAFNLRTYRKLHDDSVVDGAGYFGNFEKIADELKEVRNGLSE